MANPFEDPELLAAMARFGVVHRPGSAQEALKELAPLLAAEGVDLDDPDADFDINQLNAALTRATERRNLEIATPIGEHRTRALAVLRTSGIAFADGRPDDAAALLGDIEPDETENRPSASHVIGAGLGALDTWFADPSLGGMLSVVRMPKWHSKPSRNVANDILALASKHRAFDSLHSLIVRHAGLAVLEGTALAVAGALAAIANREGSSVAEISARLLTAQDAAIPEASRPEPRQGSGAAFGVTPPLITAADHGLLSRFGAWLEREPYIAGPAVEIELAMFEHLLTIAREYGLDLDRPKDMLPFCLRFFDPDEYEEPEGFDTPGMQMNTAYTLDDYLHFQLQTAKHPDAWERAHGFIEELLDDLSAELDDRSGAPSDELIRIAQEADSLDPTPRLAALARVPLVNGVRELLVWVGKRRRVTQTGAVRRNEIGEVAAFLGINAQGVAKHPDPEFDPALEFDAEPDYDAIVYASSMWEVPALAAWWESLKMLEIIRTNTSSVSPGPAAETWLAQEPVPIELAGQLVAATVAYALTVDLVDERSSFFAFFDRGAFALTIARLLGALSPEHSPGRPADENDLRTVLLLGRSTNMLRTLERFGVIALDPQGEPVIAPELRGVMAKAVMFAIMQLDANASIG